MKVFIVYAHPEPTSFCAALKNHAVATLEAAGHEVLVSDLYAENFNPVAGRHDFLGVHDPDRFHYQNEQLHAAEGGGFSPELAREQERLQWCDVAILVFPLWWSNLPAILKGWADRVLAYGFAYLDGLRFERGLFKGKRGMVCVTTGGTTERFSPDGVYGPIGPILRPANRGVFEYLGMEVIDPFVAYAAPRVDDDERRQYLSAWEQRLKQL
ncbi:NAD(P)H-dependent oxidoreductase [Microbaculum marinum]|uniref:NAD(P)H-dependent oxidoreductase n=1 Tax=Microbaculum marinum TaxID=1764581 RepID=A0AAW9RYG3_9HYPH